jgi:hypothetical protein
VNEANEENGENGENEENEDKLGLSCAKLTSSWAKLIQV